MINKFGLSKIYVIYKRKGQQNNLGIVHLYLIIHLSLYFSYICLSSVSRVQMKRKGCHMLATKTGAPVTMATSGRWVPCATITGTVHISTPTSTM